MKRLKSIYWGALGVILLTVPAAYTLANVSLKNGNWFVSYTDIVYPGGFEPKIARVYNSKSNYHGMFGYGWGTEYEVTLTVSADGSVVIQEYGGGSSNRFNPTSFNARELDDAVNKLAVAAEKAGLISSAQSLANYKKRLHEDADFRNDEWQKFQHQGRVQARQLPVNTVLISNRFSYQKVVRTRDGYLRIFESGRVEKFNDSGHLVRVSDKDGNYIDFTYGADGHIQKLVDNMNRRMVFHFNAQGLLASIDGESGKHAEYKYNRDDELIASKDVDGNRYTYKYDSSKRHNMTEVGYSDKTTMQISYYDRVRFPNKHENVHTYKDRDGSLTEYNYDEDSGDKGHMSVSITVKGSDGKQISSSRYEYFNKRKADGEEWLYKMVSVLDGDKTETIYNECCGLPLLIKRGGEETAFEYDTKGRVTKKTTPNEVTELTYDNRVGKVIRVVKFSKTDKKKSSWSQFHYDAKGNLDMARNSDGKGVKLFYDSSGQIRTMVDQNQRQIQFKYNENHKPVEIADPKMGAITVSYSNSGEVRKVESSAGRKVALEVTSAFQNLLDIIRPAGVSLSF